MIIWACSMVCLRRGPPYPHPREIWLDQKRLLSLHLLCIRVVPVSVPVRLNPVVLSGAPPRGLHPRGTVIGILPPPSLVIGGGAVGTNNCVHLKKCVCILCVHFKNGRSVPKKARVHLKREGVSFFTLRVGERTALRISLVFAFFMRIGDRAVFPRLRHRIILLTLSL